MARIAKYVGLTGLTLAVLAVPGAASYAAFISVAVAEDAKRFLNA